MLDADEVRRAGDVQVGGASIDRWIATLAERQHGVVARRQLLALGVSREAIQPRIEAGRLHVLFRGVYAVGHRALTQHGRFMAAVLAAGTGAVLSHRAAAALWRMLGWYGGRIDVIVPRARAQRPGLRQHRFTLADDEFTTCESIPVTTPARTIFDLAAGQRPERVKRAADEASYLQLTSPAGLGVLLDRHPRRPGAAVLRAILTSDGRRRTRTEMEADFLSFCTEHGLPLPDEMNVCRHIHGRLIEADGVYIVQRIIIELDGGSHMTPKRFNDDRSRDRANLVDDWRTVRVTSRHLDDPRERRELAADLTALLLRRG